MKYPDGLPCPLIEGYSAVVENGLTSIMFEHGNTRQRKLTSLERTVVSFTLTLSTRQLWIWQSWANKYGHNWHDMMLFTQYSGYSNTVMVPHKIRYIGDALTIIPVGPDHFQANVVAEVDLYQPTRDVIVKSNLWIIARTPANPSSPDRYLAGTVGNPSFNWVVAGSPQFPAA